MRQYFRFYILMFSLGLFINKISFAVQVPQIFPPPERGIDVLPVPQRSHLKKDISHSFDQSWGISSAKTKAAEQVLAGLMQDLNDRFQLTITNRNKINTSKNTITLVLKKGIVQIPKDISKFQKDIENQAYHLVLNEHKIIIEANAAQGLFYGVQTLLQLIRKNQGKLYFPEGEITDWPEMPYRIIYWDDAHHLERPEAMKRIIRQAAFYKINAISLKLEGHFQFPSAPLIVEPYAYSPKEYQELTRYALAYHVQLIPYLDAPAHISFILKHSEYAKYRAYSNNNYEISTVNPDAKKFMVGLFQDLANASRGVDFIHFSTDEAYYVGKAPGEVKVAEKLGGNGKLLGQFVTDIATPLHNEGRDPIIWYEFPFTDSDVSSIPKYIINGVLSEDMAESLAGWGVRQMKYTSTQGVEPLFPNYFKSNFTNFNDGLGAKSDDENAQGNLENGRIGRVIKDLSKTYPVKDHDLMGVIIAGWGDTGLNPETFWLGYVSGTSFAWNSSLNDPNEIAGRFYKTFYGPDITAMNIVYKYLSEQADFWDKSWKKQPSGLRYPILGNSYGIFDTPRLEWDYHLSIPPYFEGVDLSMEKNWNTENMSVLDFSRIMLDQNNELFSLLNMNIDLADFNQYNLLVFNSIAKVCRENLNFILNLKDINDFMSYASELSSDKPKMAIELIDKALNLAMRMKEERNRTLNEVTAVWYQEWFPRVEEANGRKFMNRVDDIKDHRPLRTVDMSYIIYREIHYPMQNWYNSVRDIRNQFAIGHNLPEREKKLNWLDYKD